MRIVCLSENTACQDIFGCEHGLSLYIETENRRILFDMGQTALFSQNAARLGVDLSKVDTAVLSHGHYDHGGGLRHFLEINDHAPVYVSAHAFEPHYNGTEKYIGLDTALRDHPRLIFTSGTHKIGEGMTLYTCPDCDRRFTLGSFGLKIRSGDAFIPDDFRHEQYLMIEEYGKRVLFSGCSHRGVLDIVRWFLPSVLIGGFHFSKLALDDTLREYAAYLDRFDTDYYTCHCTGTDQYEFMRTHMARLGYLSAGQEIQL